MLDDERMPVSLGWSFVDGPILVPRTFEEFKIDVLANRGNISTISFDHDLGLCSKSGYDCITWLESQIHFGNVPIPDHLVAHSMNPIGRKRIEQVINQIYLKGR
jgi:hypothetical protein